MRKKDQSTDFLKGCLSDALFKLLKEKEYDKITVGEITALANVSRATYYRHFQSKDELLLYKIDHFTDEWLASVFGGGGLSLKEFLTLYVRLIYDNRSCLRLLYPAGKKGILEEYLLRRIVSGRVPAEFQYRQIGRAFYLLGMFSLWIQRDFQETPEELMGIILRPYEDFGSLAADAEKILKGVDPSADF